MILVDLESAVISGLVLCRMPRFQSLSIASRFCSRFSQIPARDDVLGLHRDFTSIWLSKCPRPAEHVRQLEAVPASPFGLLVRQPLPRVVCGFVSSEALVLE